VLAFVLIILGTYPAILVGAENSPQAPGAEQSAQPQGASDEANRLAPQALAGVLLTLPEKTNIKVHWVSPPLAEEVVEKQYPSNLQLAIDSSGTPWIGYDWRYLLNPVKQLHVQLPVQYTSLTCTDKGALLLATHKTYGFVWPPDELPQVKGPVDVGYQAVANLPTDGARVVAGVGDCLYFLASRPTGGSDVYVQAPKQLGFGGFVRVFTSDREVTAVAGDGKTTFVAMDGLIAKVELPGSSVTTFLSRPGQHFAQLAWLPKGGLFYNTGTNVGFLGEKGADFTLLVTPGAQLALHDDALYVLLEKTLGVFVLENVSDLQRFDGAVRPLAVAELGVKVHGLRFFKAQTELEELPPIEQITFADRFDRGEPPAWLYCLVDVDKLGDEARACSCLLDIVLHEAATKDVVWRDQQVVRIGPEEGRVWVWPCVGRVADIYPGEYVAKAYLNGALVGEANLEVTGEVSLMEAVAHNDLTRAKRALAAKPDINAKDEDGWTPLSTAIHSGSADMVRLLLQAGADPNVKDKDGWTPLMFAVTFGSVDMVKALLQARADLKARDKDGWTPLMFAVTYGSAEMVKLLLQAGADPNAKDNDGYPILLRAVRNADVQVVKLLLDAKADVKARDKDGSTVLHELVYREAHSGGSSDYAADMAALVRLLVSRGAELQARDKDGYTALHTAAILGRVEVVKSLVDNGADVNETDADGWTILDLVVLGCENYQHSPEEFIARQQIAQILQAKGARISKRTYSPGVEQVLNASNLLTLLTKSEDDARRFLPDQPHLQRVSIAALLQLAQKRAAEYAEKGEAARESLQAAISLSDEAARRAQRWGLQPEYAQACLDSGVLRLLVPELADSAAWFFQECVKADPKSAAAQRARELLAKSQPRR
jgi:ankyrin repeat protein